MIRRPPRSTLSSSSAASDVYKRQVDQLQLFGDPVPVLTRREPETVAQQVNYACLHDRVGPHRGHTVGQALQPVTDHEHGVDHTPVAQLGPVSYTHLTLPTKRIV